MDIARERLLAQGILEPRTDDVAEIVRRLGAMQAQDYAGALWSIGLRMKHPSLKAVEKAIGDRKIVRTWPMRGTLHFLAAEDVHWILKLLAPRATQVAKSRRINQLGLTDAVVDEAEKALRAVLKGGKSIQRNHVASLLAAKVKGLKIDNQHTQHLMRNFGERGIICFGPHEGKQPTFVLLDEWVKPGPKKDRDEALKELALRYFTSHGPATLKDFAGWGFMTMRDAKNALELARLELQETVVSDTAYYRAPTLGPVDVSSAFLLPGFDEYLLGYKDRSAVLAPEHAGKIVPGGNGMFLPTLVRNGQVIGTWKRYVKRSGVSIDYLPFEVKRFDEGLFMPAAERYQNFLST